jgi:hypothetical protein
MVRLALQNLLIDVEARRIDVVIVYKVDRLTRSLADFAKLVETFDAHGVSFDPVLQHHDQHGTIAQRRLRSWPPCANSGHPLRRGKQAHMRDRNPPTLVGAQLDVALAACRRHAEIPCWPSPSRANRSDSSRHVHNWPSDKKRRDSLMPIEIFGDSESKRERALPEELIERGDVIDDHRALGMVTIKIQLTCLVRRELLNVRHYAE